MRKCDTPLPSECSHPGPCRGQGALAWQEIYKEGAEFPEKMHNFLTEGAAGDSGARLLPPSHSELSPASSWFRDTSPTSTLLLSPGLRTTILIFLRRVSPGSVGPAVGLFLSLIPLGAIFSVRSFRQETIFSWVLSELPFTNPRTHL